VLPGPRKLIVQVSVNGGEAVPLSVPFKQPATEIYVAIEVAKTGRSATVSGSGAGFSDGAPADEYFGRGIGA